MVLSVVLKLALLPLSVQKTNPVKTRLGHTSRLTGSPKEGFTYDNMYTPLFGSMSTSIQQAVSETQYQALFISLHSSSSVSTYLFNCLILFLNLELPCRKVLIDILLQEHTLTVKTKLHIPNKIHHLNI